MHILGDKRFFANEVSAAVQVKDRKMFARPFRQLEKYVLQSVTFMPHFLFVDLTACLQTGYVVPVHRCSSWVTFSRVASVPKFCQAVVIIKT